MDARRRGALNGAGERQGEPAPRDKHKDAKKADYEAWRKARNEKQAAAAG
jgi:hypothetical protein